MSYGAAFLFDERTEAALRGLWQSLADAGLSSFMLGLDYPPHLTAFLAEEFDEPAMRRVVTAFAAECQPVEVTFPALGVFPGAEGVVFLAPVASPALTALHTRLWQSALPVMRSPAPYHAPEVWVPHVTLGIGLTPGVLGAAVEVLVRAAWPTPARIERVLIGKFQVGDGNVHEVFPLGAA